MTPWFKNATPHQDIRDGNLDESVFAANINEVAMGTANDIYCNPETFFSKTFLTSGLKTICKRVIKGLQGNADAGDRNITLQTGFGGGKTHSLIAVYHCAKLGRNLREIEATKEMVLSFGDITLSNARIAVFTNRSNDPVQGRKVGDIHIRTMWGEIAYQLAGLEGYEIVRENDIARVSPKGLLKKILEISKPSLILIDELADYCVAASGIKVNNTTLGDQTISFMQELSEAVASVPNTVLIATLPASATEISASQIGITILNSLTNRLSRVSADTKPVNDDEIYEVIRRRLFEYIGDTTIIEKVASEYLNSYNRIRTEIPQFAIRQEYKQKMIQAYPFHPELIEMFHIKWSSNPLFQRTRGILKLLATIINDLWVRQNSLTGDNSLIQTSDVNFANLDALSNQLTRLFGDGYNAVISGDVSGSVSNAFRIDSSVTEYGQYNLAQGIASTILLGTFGRTGAQTGLSIKELKLCVMKPDSFNHNSINAVLDRLEENAHFLFYNSEGVESKHYWFRTKPNINILINQAKAEVHKNKVEIHKEIIKRLEGKKNQITKFNALIAPSGDIPEQLKPTLIFLHPQHQVNGGFGNVENEIVNIATKKGSGERVYRNTLLFTSCSELGYNRLESEIVSFLACYSIKQNYSTSLEQDQKEDIKKRIETCDQAIERNLCSAYTALFKHVKKDGIQRLNIKQFNDTLDSQVNNIFYDTLKEEEWILESVGLALLSKNNLLPSENSPVNVKDIYNAFLQFDDKPIIKNVEAVQSSLLKYCLEGEFAIASGEKDHFSKVYYKEQVPYFDVTQPTYWLVDKSMFVASIQATTVEPQTTLTQPTAIPEGSTPTPVNKVDEEKKINSITISGKVPIENWANIFTYFIQVLRENNIEATISLKAKSTTTKPLTESCQTYKQAKENAKALGLNFNEE